MALQRSDLPHLVLALKDVHHNWQLFGSQLGLLPAKLKDIKAKNGKRDPTECFREALEAWFESGEVCTCQKLVAALKDCDNKKLSVQFSEQHSNELDVPLTVDCLDRVMKQLNEMVPEWSTFCLFLGVSDEKLEYIEQSTSPKKCTQAMLAQWIKDKGEEATVHVILDALRSPVIGYNALARKLEEENVFFRQKLAVQTDRPVRMELMTDGGTPEEDMLTATDAM